MRRLTLFLGPTIGICLGLLIALTASALAQSAPPVDAVQLLTAVGLGGQAAAIIGMYLLFSNLCTILVPWLMVPTESSTIWYRCLYWVISQAGAHNYRNAANAVQPVPPAPRPAPGGRTALAVLAVLMVPVLALASCAPANTSPSTSAASVQQGIGRVVQAGQLVCAKATTSGPLVVALVSAIDQRAIQAANSTKQYVDLACALVGAIPVSPPPEGQAVPTMAIVPPS